MVYRWFYMLDTAESNTNIQHTSEVKPPSNTNRKTLVLLANKLEKADTKPIATMTGINGWKFSAPVMLNVNPIATSIPVIPAIVALLHFNFTLP
jgi:hypothetical protein